MNINNKKDPNVKLILAIRNKTGLGLIGARAMIKDLDDKVKAKMLDIFENA